MTVQFIDRVQFNGSGSMSARAVRRAKAQVSFAGTGHLSALVRMRARIQARFAGAGKLNVGTTETDRHEWPLTLPYAPVMASFRREVSRMVLTSDVGEGALARRLQTQTDIRRMSYNLVFTDAQKTIFESFFENNLNHGLDFFTMPVPLDTEEYVERLCYIEQGKWTDTEESPGVITVSFTLCVLGVPLA